MYPVDVCQHLSSNSIAQAIINHALFRLRLDAIYPIQKAISPNPTPLNSMDALQHLLRRSRRRALGSLAGHALPLTPAQFSQGKEARSDNVSDLLIRDEKGGAGLSPMKRQHGGFSPDQLASEAHLSSTSTVAAVRCKFILLLLILTVWHRLQRFPPVLRLRGLQPKQRRSIDPRLNLRAGQCPLW